MVKAKTRWVCQECGFQTSGFLGRCTECGTWNAFAEELAIDEAALGRKGPTRLAINQNVATSGLLSLADMEEAHAGRIATGIKGLDLVLGGGLVPGAVILLAGDPGIGKSTLLLQVAATLSTQGRVLYVSGEESASQVRLRAARLGFEKAQVLVSAEQNVLAIAQSMAEPNVDIVIIDSVQAIYHPELTSASGSVSQVRESAQLVCNAAKANNVATIIVGHVNKEGAIAGPRVLEHMVDVVLQFEGDCARELRLLRSVKNRYGSTAELAIFTMSEKGLTEVENASALFLGQRLSNFGRQAPSGTAVIAGGEHSRTILLEVQALVGLSTYPSPRRVANGWDYNRLLQILAVLEKKLAMSLARFDVYINIVGGLDFNDPSGDLGISIAIASSHLDRSMDPALLMIGEIGLTGEVRPVGNLAPKLKEAAKLGFKRALVPKANLPLSFDLGSLQLIGVEFLAEAMDIAMPNFVRNAPLAFQPKAQVNRANESNLNESL